MAERTLIIIKPDAVQRQLIGRIITRFEDKGLKPHTVYYYRVRAVDRDGHKGQPSSVCRGVTRELQ